MARATKPRRANAHVHHVRSVQPANARAILFGVPGKSRHSRPSSHRGPDPSEFERPCLLVPGVAERFNESKILRCRNAWPVSHVVLIEMP